MPATNKRRVVKYDADGRRLCKVGHIAYCKNNGRWSCRACERAYLKAQKKPKYQQTDAQYRIASNSADPIPVDESTDTKPGSRERIEELARRSALGLELWHKDDVTHELTGLDCVTQRDDSHLMRSQGAPPGKHKYPKKKG